MKFIICFVTIFTCILSHSQKTPSTKIYNYLTGMQNWKLVLTADNAFVLTTNRIFGQDTSVIVKGKFIREDSLIRFITDSSSLKERVLLKAKFSNEQLIAQNEAFPKYENIISFRNVMRQIHDTSTFYPSVIGTYYRSDGVWSNEITLYNDHTYRISESVHSDVEYTQTGKWKYKNGFIIFLRSNKKSNRLKDYSSNRKFYVTKDFLIGCLKSKDKKTETYYYFNKAPIAN